MDTDRSTHWQRKHAWSRIGRCDPPKRAAQERVADFLEVYGNLDEQTAREQASRCIQCPEPACIEACPLHNRIPEWLECTAEGRFLDAAMLSRSTSNMPEICSRVCPQERLCEGSCFLNGISEPVLIGALERFINEYAFRHLGTTVARPAPNGRRVAVVGSGPGGLAAADELAGMGYAVTVFESQAIPGGLLVNGIPAFKLEKTIVARRIDVLKGRGVEFRLGVALGGEVSLKALLRDHDAVFLGFGAQQAKGLGVPGEDLEGVLPALPFLIQKNVPESMPDLPPIEVKGRRVVVLGGGDTAMDCLRTALRCGAGAAVCIYRRDLANMPGSRKEYANALEEGADFRFLSNPVAVEGNGAGTIERVRCVRMELGEPDETGRRSPQAVPGAEFVIDADLVIGAYGFDPVPIPPHSDLAAVEVNRWGGIVVDGNQMTSVPGVFAGGDSVRGPSLVVHAVRDARKAAQGIHRYLGQPEVGHLAGRNRSAEKPVRVPQATQSGG
jgi:glutamate synthase (NADPH/NADH) small chain